MAKTSLPPGFRFHPTDVELTVYYLKRKLLGKHIRCNAVTEIDLYKFAPWDLPGKASLESDDLVWYFFCRRDRKYSSGVRTNRSTGVGYWKATGKDRPVIYNSRIVGMKRTLVFHLGKPPRGDRTDWVMYEYRLEDKDLAACGVKLDACVLCKIFQKRGRGPKIGAQYGAPFNEAEWNGCSVEYLSCVPSATPCAPESNHDGFNSAGQRQAVSNDGNVSLGLSSESNGECAGNHVQGCPNIAPDIPFDSIHLHLLAEIISCSSMNPLCTADEGDSQPVSTPDNDNGDKTLSDDDNETIFSRLDDDLAPQSMESNSRHCGSCGRNLIQPMLEAVGGEQFLEPNDLSFSLVDDPNSCSMLLSGVEQPLQLDGVPKLEQDCKDYVSDIASASH